MIRQGTNDDLPLGCNSTGDQDRSTPAMRCACLPTQQQATHHSAIHGYGCLPDLCPVPPIRLRSRWEGCSPWFRSIRSDGSRGRMLGCRVPWVRVVWYGLIVARNGSAVVGVVVHTFGNTFKEGGADACPEFGILHQFSNGTEPIGRG